MTLPLQKAMNDAMEENKVTDDPYVTLASMGVHKDEVRAVALILEIKPAVASALIQIGYVLAKNETEETI